MDREKPWKSVLSVNRNALKKSDSAPTVGPISLQVKRGWLEDG